MGYVGTAPLSGDYRKLDDISSGFNGSTTGFTLQVGSVNVTPQKKLPYLFQLVVSYRSLYQHTLYLVVL